MSSEEKKKKKIAGIEINEFDDQKKASLLNRVLVALGILAVIIPCIILGGYFFFVLIFVASIASIYEFIHVPRKKYKWYVWFFVYLLTISFIYWAFVKWNISDYLSDRENYVFSLESNFNGLSVSVYALASELGLLFFCAVAHEDFTMRDIAFLFAMSVLIGLGMQSLLFARYYPINTFAKHGYTAEQLNDPAFKYWGSVVFFFFTEFTCVMTDTWAFFVGVFFGKHKMNPRVSPKRPGKGSSAAGYSEVLVALPLR